MTDTLVMTSRIFGIESRDPEEAASRSSVLFVRDQDHVAFFRDGATGRVLTALEALNAFGLKKLHEAWDYGAAVIVSDSEEPGASIRHQREALGLDQERLAIAAGTTPAVLDRIECGKSRESIHVIERLAQYLALDDTSLSVVRGANADSQLAVRLKEYSSGGSKLSPAAVLALSEASWVARTEARLASLLGQRDDRWRSFAPTDDLGDWYRPTWKVGYELAARTRSELGLAEHDPIPSIRDLVGQLGVMLVQAALPPSIAGATVAVDSQRAIVVNTTGANSNPWIRRATVAHELGHLLWDPTERLNHLKVDQYGELDQDYSHESDLVEARANAFAIAFLAPPQSVISLFSSFVDPRAGLRGVMESFGISKTAARHHIANAHQNAGVPLRYDLHAVHCNSAASHDWAVRENMTLDWFPIQSTPTSRRGSFAARVVDAERRGLISSSTAASYLDSDVDTFEANRDALVDVLDLGPLGA